MKETVHYDTSYNPEPVTLSFGVNTALDLRNLEPGTEFNWAYVKACESVYSSGMSNVDGLRIPVKSNWNLEYLSKQLVNYTDKEIVQLLQFGFPIECATQGQGEIKFSKNHAGAEQFPDDIDAYIAKELKKGTLIGPFKTNPFGSKARFSPMNTRPKKESSERRIIMDGPPRI